ncbi:MAG TPA: DUF72 domain-containing protein [Acidimicrobiales bacterium]|nr:DUF72 domain-containing protein [Acidimicrobiales bacterium]
MEGAAGVDHDIDDGRSGTRYACVRAGDNRVLFGTTSWADRGLVQSGSFYPKKTMTARERLGYYATRFPLAEIATTYRFPPTPELSRQWVERTPDGFTFDLRAWSLLTGAPTMPDSLWPDLQDELRDRSRDQRRLYPGHLSSEGYEECWERFAHAIRPLRDAGRLGVVILQYPSWFSPRPEAWAELALARHRLSDVRLAVEFRSPKWLEGDACEPTLEWLEEHGLGFVCVDGPAEGPRALPAVSAVTSDVAVVRFVGRRHVEDEPWTWPYRYSADELLEWVPRLLDLASSATEVHVLMDNSWRSDAVDNAAGLASLLAADQPDGAG